MAEIDTSFYTKAPASTPLDIAGQVGGVANAIQQNKLLHTQNQQAKIDLVSGQVGAIANAFSSLASKPNLTAQDMYDLGNRLVEQGVIAPEVLGAEMNNIPQNATPDQLRQIATGYSLRALDAGQRFAQQYGTTMMVDTGNYQVPVAVSPLTGMNPIGAPIQNTLTPAQLATPTVTGVNPMTLQPITGTQAQFLEQTGSNPLTGMPMQAAPAAPAAPASGGLPPVAAPSGPPGVTQAPAPGAAEAATQVGAQSGSQYATDLGEAGNFQANVLPLEKAIPTLERLGTTGTGPGREQINQISSFLQSMGVPGIDPNGVKDFDEAKKYLVQFVNTTGNSGTNDKLAASFAGNPSVEISNAAAIDVAKTALSLARLDNAQVRAFQQSGLPAEQYSRYVAEWNAQQDPRAFGFDMISPENRTKLVESLSPDERAKFVNSLRTAVSLGLVTPPAQ